MTAATPAQQRDLDRVDGLLRPPFRSVGEAVLVEVGFQLRKPQIAMPSVLREVFQGELRVLVLLPVLIFRGVRDLTGFSFGPQVAVIFLLANLKSQDFAVA